MAKGIPTSILRIHHAYIEKQYIEFKTLGDDQGRKLKKAQSDDELLVAQLAECRQWVVVVVAAIPLGYASLVSFGWRRRLYFDERLKRTAVT